MELEPKLTFNRLAFSFMLGILVLAATIIACSLIGEKTISLANLLENSSSNVDYEIFYQIRLPRVILAAVVGAALAACGAVLQALLKNPLADPYILGISSGAGVGAMFASLAGLQFTFLGRGPIAICAFIGAFITVWLVWTIGSLADRRNTTGLLLAGVVVNAFFSAIIMFMVSVAKSQDVQTTMVWLMGNISEEKISTVLTMAGATFVSLILLMRLAPSLNLLSFSESQAKTIGVNTAKVRFFAFLIAAFITSIAVSLSGLIGFVGLIVPHAVRLVSGPDHRKLLPMTAISGAVFMVIADTIARIAISPAQLPVGILTAILGGPFFIVLLIKNSRKTSLI